MSELVVLPPVTLEPFVSLAALTTEPFETAPPLTVPVIPGPRGERGPAGADGTAAVLAHIADDTPHPAYDDLPSLSLIFENGII